VKCVQTGHSQEEFRVLSRRILEQALSGLPEAEYASEVAGILMGFSGCEEVELQVMDGNHITQYRSRGNGEGPPCLEVTKFKKPVEESISPVPSGASEESGRLRVILPLAVGQMRIGTLFLTWRRSGGPTKTERGCYEDVAQALATALVGQRSHAALRERVKELTCLYGIAQVTETPGISLEDMMRRIVALLPPAWQYPDAIARILLDGQEYSTGSWLGSEQTQRAGILVKGQSRGSVEVAYPEAKPERDEGPFLREERHLIDAVARQVGFIVERRQTQVERSQLQEQLMHADRLATIGQLAAGVAHELNEPLGNILGFAQLAKKSSGLPEQAGHDLGKIERAAVHAREIISKLLVFARQVPSKKTSINLNTVIEEGLYFLEARCVKAGIEVQRSLLPGLPDMVGDAALLTQVLVNLVVNAIQAMPEGGKLKVETRTSGEDVFLVIEDTGVGMSPETVKQIFVPFFTTKDIGEGTGLGLPVVHGIVTSHGGLIHVESEVGRGTRFEIRLPVDGGPAGEETG